MHQFSSWRYWLVGIVMALGIVFALPNVFGEDPALQLARSDRSNFEAAGEQRIRGILANAGISVTAAYIEDGRLTVRLKRADDQIKARDAILASTNDEFSVAITRAARTPDFIRNLGLKPMSLGLDLRGGVHFLYQVDVKGAIAQSLQRLTQDVRTQLRRERIAYTGAVVQEDAVRVTLRNAGDVEAAIKAIRGDDNSLVIEQQAEGGVPVLVVRYTPEALKQRQDLAIEQNITTLRNRVDELGVSEPVVAKQGMDRILVQLPGVQDPNQAMRILGATATLEFRLEDAVNDAYEAERTKRIPIGSKLYKYEGRPVLLKRDVIASGDQLTDARSAFADGQPAVNVKLDARAGAEMLKTTQANLGKPMAVVFIESKRLDAGERCDGTRSGDRCIEERVINIATIRGVFSNNFQITGLEAMEAQELALLLRAGSLATAIDIIEQRTVGPSLGQDNIDRGVRAMILGMLLTFAFMVVYYRGFGLIADVVLTANVILLVAVMSMLQASLSLPGIAGIVLTVGMAADANVLIYERIREELRNGNSPHAAINAGFDKAFSAIADSNITTFIAGIVLFTFGTGPIKGFAVTLMIGIATSLFTAILGSRVLIQLVWGRRRQLQALPV